MVEITARDISLFRVIGLGVANKEMIMSLLRDVFVIEISRHAFEKRVSILRADGYIISKKYVRIKKHGHKTLYSLTKKSVEVLAALGRPVEQLRYGLPSDPMALHELTITETLHSLVLDSAQALYKFRATDSAILKLCRKKRSREPIPDLRLELTFKDGHQIVINMEIDRGTIPSHRVGRRLRLLSDRKETILVLCSSKSRIAGLRKAYIDANIFHSEFIYFSLQEDFKHKGFQSTCLINMKGDTRYLNLHNQKKD
jgi:hypothetical protein